MSLYLLVFFVLKGGVSCDCLAHMDVRFRFDPARETALLSGECKKIVA